MSKRDYSETIAAMRKLGWSYRKIAQALKISHEQVRQINQKTAAKPKRKAKGSSSFAKSAIVDVRQRLLEIYVDAFHGPRP